MHKVEIKTPPLVFDTPHANYNHVMNPSLVFPTVEEHSKSTNVDKKISKVPSTSLPYSPTQPEVDSGAKKFDMGKTEWTPLHSDILEKLSNSLDFEVKNLATQSGVDSVAMKFDTGKTDWTLMPFDALEEINKVLDFGAKKYAAHNWKKNAGFKYSRVLGSLMRHIYAYIRGQDNDPESGLSHLAHAGCNILFLLYYNKYKDVYNKDDRFIETSKFADK